MDKHQQDNYKTPDGFGNIRGDKHLGPEFAMPIYGFEPKHFRGLKQMKKLETAILFTSNETYPKVPYETLMSYLGTIIPSKTSLFHVPAKTSSASKNTGIKRLITLALDKPNLAGAFIINPSVMHVRSRAVFYKLLAWNVDVMAVPAYLLLPRQYNNESVGQMDAYKRNSENVLMPLSAREYLLRQHQRPIVVDVAAPNFMWISGNVLRKLKGYQNKNLFRVTDDCMDENVSFCRAITEEADASILLEPTLFGITQATINIGTETLKRDYFSALSQGSDE